MDSGFRCMRDPVHIVSKSVGQAYGNYNKIQDKYSGIIVSPDAIRRL